VLRAFIVDRDADELIPAFDTEVVERVWSELDRLMGIKSSVEFTTVHRWPKSMPQYTVGHSGRRERIEGRMRNHPHLHLVGNAYDGVGIPDCVRLAKTSAERIGRRR
jgi:oxygen-dependent protoporphyrinogen oxidase